MSKRRAMRAVLAALLSLLVPGLGHLYAKGIELAIRLYFLVFLAVTLTLFVFAGAFWTMALSFLVTFVLVLLICVDAIHRASAEEFHPKSGYRHPLVYIMIIAVHVLGVGPLFRSASPYRAYRIPTSSMAPTLQVGDVIMTRKTPGGFYHAKRGQLVVLAYPGVPHRPVVKRVVGLEGETIETHGRSVMVDGRPLDEPYAAQDEVDPVFDSGPTFVSRGNFFVLGDNRGHSDDSRHFGPVPGSSIEAHVLYRYLSKDLRRIGRTFP